MGKFVGNPEAVIAAVTQQPSVSLGDVARLYKARRGSDHPKEFDNAKLEGRFDGTPQNSAAPQSSNEAPATNTDAQNQQAPLDQRDLAVVERELARSRLQTASNAAANQGASSSENTTIAQASEPQSANQAGNQASNQASNQSANAPASAASTPQAPSNANAQAKTQKKQQLPASASPLPLLGLMGVLAAGAGAVYAFRSRT
jgi:cobalamin biosynthesis Mg chelatase CobN